MRETVMFLTCPGAGLDVINGRDVCSPVGLASHFVEFAVLNHHSMNDSKERFIRWEDASSTCERVA